MGAYKIPFIFKAFFALAAAGSPVFLEAQSIWIGSDFDEWNQDANWNPSTGFPNGVDATAQFGAAGAGSVILNEPITIGHLVVTGGAYTLGVSPVDLTFATSGSQNATIDSMSPSLLHLNTNGGNLFVLSPLVVTGRSINSTILINSTTVHASNPITITKGELFISNLGVGGFFGSDITVDDLGIFTFYSDQISSIETLNGSGYLSLNDTLLQITGPGDSLFSGLIGSSPASTIEIEGRFHFSGDNSENFATIKLINQGSFVVSESVHLGAISLALEESGTLQVVGNTPFTASTPISLIGRGVLDIGADTRLTLSGSISENPSNSSLLKRGEGTLILNGANSYTGTTTVSAGRLNVNGSHASAMVEVNGGSTLGGTGFLQSVVVNSGGTLSPGNSIGTIHIDSLVLDPDSRTLIEIDPTLSSSISVAGTALLDGHVQVLQNEGNYPPSGSYAILNAGAIAGSFDPTVLGGSPGYHFSLMADDNNVTLLYEFVAPTPSPINALSLGAPAPSTQISTTGLRGNTAVFARYLNQSAPDSAAKQALANLSGTALKDALNSASPARNFFGSFANQNVVFGFSQLLDTHLTDQRFSRTERNLQPSVASLFAEHAKTPLLADASDAPFTKKECETVSFWMGGIGEYARQKSQNQNPSFHFESGGALAGFDFYGAGRNLFGFAGGYAFTHLSENGDGGYADLNTYLAALYDTLYYSRGYVELAVWGAYNQTHNHRHISFPGFDATAAATIRSWQLVPHIGLGYHKQYGWGDFEPFAQADCAINWQESYSEQGAGDLNMTQESQTSELLRTEAGFRFYESNETHWGAWMVMEKISYVNKKTFHTGEITAAIVGTNALFSVESFQGVQNLGSAGIEFLWRFGHRKPVTFTLAYNGEMGSKYLSHEGMVQLRKDF